MHRNTACMCFYARECTLGRDLNSGATCTLSQFMSLPCISPALTTIMGTVAAYLLSQLFWGPQETMGKNFRNTAPYKCTVLQTIFEQCSFLIIPLQSFFFFLQYYCFWKNKWLGISFTYSKHKVTSEELPADKLIEQTWGHCWTSTDGCKKRQMCKCELVKNFLLHWSSIPTFQESEMWMQENWTVPSQITSC